MVVIFGFGSGKQEDLGEIAPSVCPNCHNQVFLHLIRTKKSVRLYFVPVVPYGTDYYLVCPICSRGLQIRDAQLPHVRSMSGATRSCRAGRLAQPNYLAQVERFWRQLGVNPATAAGPATPARPSPASAEDDTSWISQLQKLAQLHDQGVLSDADYENAKRRLIENTGSP